MTLRAVWYQYAEMHEKVSLRGKPYAGALVEYRDRAGSVVYTLKASGTDGNCTDYVCERTKPGEYDLYIDGKYIRPVTVNRSAAGYFFTSPSAPTSRNSRRRLVPPRCCASPPVSSTTIP